MKIKAFNVLAPIIIIGTIILFWNKIGWLRLTTIMWGIAIIISLNGIDYLRNIKQGGKKK